MKSFTLATAMLISSGAAAMACPDWTQPGVQTYATTGEDLWSLNSYSVTAGGSVDLGGCSMPGIGYVISQPDFEFSLSGMAQYGRLNIRVNGQCDTVLLVNDAAGNWYFNDDSSGYDPSVDVPSQDGVYDIWVGTYGASTCGATLTLETF